LRQIKHCRRAACHAFAPWQRSCFLRRQVEPVVLEGAAGELAGVSGPKAGQGGARAAEMTEPMRAQGYLARPWARAVSLVVGLAVSLVLMIFPFVLGRTVTAVTHTGLSLLLLGVAAGLVHGFGFRPDNRMLRFVFSPLAAWPLMAAGFAILAFDGFA
jgi:predicted membrane protein